MDSPHVLETTVATFAETRPGWRYATDVISQAFSRQKQLSNAERREVSERVYGMIRMYRRIDAVIAWLLRPRGKKPEELREAELDRLRYVVYRVTIEGAPVELASVELLRLGIDAAV